MIRQQILRDLRRLRCKKTIAEQFVGLVANYLSHSSHYQEEIPDELLLLIDFCNHHRTTLGSLYRDPATVDHTELRTWLHELATPPSGEWADLRLALTPFIRAFGRLPRPRGSKLFSPLKKTSEETESRPQELESFEDAGTSAKEQTAATAGIVEFAPTPGTTYEIVRSGLAGHFTFSMSSGPEGKPVADISWLGSPSHAREDDRLLAGRA